MTSHPSLVLLNRHFGLKDNSPFSLVLDSLTQSAHHLLREFTHKFNGQVVYLSYETTVKPDYATDFKDCSSASLKEIQDFLGSLAPTKPSSKMLVIVDSLNYLPAESHVAFISGIVQPSLAVLACYHTNVPTAHASGYPSPVKLLSFIASAIFEVETLYQGDAEELDNGVSRFCFLANTALNSSKFKLNFTSRRKSGKSLVNSFTIDTKTHVYELYKPEKDDGNQDDDELLKGLTTFNLTTNSKQKLAREHVDLPYMEAQTELGKFGGAIVYEFEKDDDYDEEDPYEDPF